MEKLARNNAAFVLDALSGRLAFERTGVKLYDAAIAKLERAEPRYHAVVDPLRRIRGEEKEHEEWLESVIRQLGGHPNETTDMVQLETDEGLGIAKVIHEHDKPIHILHALLAAELADNAGWDVLVKLAGEAGDRAAKLQFAKRLAEEAKHLLFLREVVMRAAATEILGRERPLPSGMKGVVAGAMAKPIAIGGAVAAALLGAGALAASAVLVARPDLALRLRRAF